MPLVIEDGSNVAGANAYVDVAFVDARHLQTAASGWAGDAAAKEAAISRATARLDASYLFGGKRTNGRSQALQWPRTGVTDCDGVAVGDAEVPIEVQQAVAELSLAEILESSALNAETISDEALVKREKVGELEVEYAVSSDRTLTQQAGSSATLASVSALLRCLGSPRQTTEATAMFGASARA